MSAFGNPEIPTNGLEINLDVFNTVSYPGSGTSIYNVSRDRTNIGVHTITGTGFVYEDGIPTIECSGSDIITAAATIQSSLGDDYCYYGFTKMMADHGTWRTLFRGTPEDHMILIQTSTNELGFYDNDGGGWLSSGYDISPHAETWFSICANAYDGDTTDYYINGDFVGSVARNATGQSHDRIGNYSALSQPWGWVSQALLYNRQLTLGEIKRIHEAFRSRYKI